MVGTTLSIRRWQAAMQRFTSHPNTHGCVDDIKQAEVASPANVTCQVANAESCQLGSHQIRGVPFHGFKPWCKKFH